MAEVRERGIVRWYDPRRGYGFIDRPDAADLYVHARNIRVSSKQDARGSWALSAGDPVEFTVGTGPRGVFASDVEELVWGDEEPSTENDTPCFSDK